MTIEAQPYTGRCLDCDTLREVDEHGNCGTCGSGSVVVLHAIRELHARLLEVNPQYAFPAGYRL